MQVHYFPRYSQRENFETNNTLLLLREFYNYSRLRFQTFLVKLLYRTNTDTNQALDLGLQIKQQMSTKESVLDGYLYQDSFRIAIETKRRADAFSIDQLHRHLSGFSQLDGGFLILLSPERAQIAESSWKKLLEASSKKNVVLVALTFDEIIQAAKDSLSDYEEEMLALVTDYQEFCSDDGLLPIDKWTLFVPPCGQSYEINIAQNLYFCPASWARRRSRYLGIYFNKAVRHIGEIVKIVECDVVDSIVASETCLLTSDERNRIIHAAQAAKQTRGWNLQTGYQFLLCDFLFETMFEKSTPGGIMGRRYLDLRKYLKSTTLPQTKELAEQLMGRHWE